MVETTNHYIIVPLQDNLNILRSIPISDDHVAFPPINPFEGELIDESAEGLEEVGDVIPIEHTKVFGPLWRSPKMMKFLIFFVITSPFSFPVSCLIHYFDRDIILKVLNRLRGVYSLSTQWRITAKTERRLFLRAEFMIGDRKVDPWKWSNDALSCRFDNFLVFGQRELPSIFHCLIKKDVQSNANIPLTQYVNRDQFDCMLTSSKLSEHVSAQVLGNRINQYTRSFEPDLKDHQFIVKSVYDGHDVTKDTSMTFKTVRHGQLMSNVLPETYFLEPQNL